MIRFGCALHEEVGGDVTVWKEANELQKYLDSCDLIIMHNGICFDAPVLRRNWNVTMKQNQMCDTLVLSRLLNPSLEGGHSLDAWGQRSGFPKETSVTGMVVTPRRWSSTVSKIL